MREHLRSVPPSASASDPGELGGRRLLYLCPDIPQPTGGVRVIYRHVDLLNAAGGEALVVHQQPGFRCSWFEHDTRVTDQGSLRGDRDRDVLVIPEILAHSGVRIAAGVPKVIFNQNAYYTFNNVPAETSAAEMPYVHPDVRATLVVSDDSLRYLRHAFPSATVRRIRVGVDCELFRPNADKGWRIGYMPRKNPFDSRQVLALLRLRGALEGIEVVALDDLPLSEVARALSQTLVFLSFGHPEGFGLPAAEAMAAGCLTVGYHGMGGSEFLAEPFGFPIAHGDIVGFAMTVERLLDGLRSEPEPLLARAEAASARINERYSLEEERRTVLAAWAEILTML